jgi:hypothetical protein
MKTDIGASALKGIVALGEGIAGMVGVAGTAVKVTAEVAQKAVDVSGKVAGAAVDAAGVLGTSTLNAASSIGDAGLKTTTAVAESGLQITTKAAKTTAAVAESGLDLVEKTADTAAEIGSAALDAASVSSKAVLKTTATTVEAASDMLQASVTAGATLVTTSLNGFKELNKRVAARGALIAQRWASEQKAEAKSIAEITDRRNAGKAAQTEFKPLAAQLREGVEKLIAVQQTTLAGNINMYRVVKCTWWKRVVMRSCETEVIKNDTLRAKTEVLNLLGEIDKKIDATSLGLLAGKDASPLITAFMNDIDAASIKFEAVFTGISDKYVNGIKETLARPPPSAAPPVAAAAAGRRRKTARKMRKRGRKGMKSRRH